MDMARRIIHDAKIDYPAACNTMVFSNFLFTFHVIQCLLFVDLFLNVCNGSVLIIE
jgi:hypothetical protein